MNWYLQSGKESDVIISTRIRFARNLQGFKFNLKTKTEINKLKNKIKENIYSIGYNKNESSRKKFNKFRICTK